MKKIRKLSELEPCSKGIVKRVEGQGNLKRKLLDMGVIPGSSIEVVKLAPLGDPVDVKIKGYHLSLRKEEAIQISVEVIE
ncbi:MAG: ferrous iron transport protein A [Candidatus Aureabacteria bacterium]|nr:ferrous iron transport protein A [Candidatus Auribacterota bacterium]